MFPNQLLHLFKRISSAYRISPAIRTKVNVFSSFLSDLIVARHAPGERGGQLTHHRRLTRSSKRVLLKLPREPFRKKVRKKWANQPKRVRARRPGERTCRKPFSPSPHGAVHLVQGRLRERVQGAKFHLESYLSESKQCR